MKIKHEDDTCVKIKILLVRSQPFHISLNNVNDIWIGRFPKVCSSHWSCTDIFLEFVLISISLQIPWPFFIPKNFVCIADGALLTINVLNLIFLIEYLVMGMSTKYSNFEKQSTLFWIFCRNWSIKNYVFYLNTSCTPRTL